MRGVLVWAFGDEVGVGGEVGFGVMVEGEESARGMDDMTRSAASGRCLIIRGGGGWLLVGLEVVD